MIEENGQAWFETALGCHLVEREQRYYDNAVSDVFGFHAVQLGLPALPLLRNSRIPLRVTCAPRGADVLADPMFLPFENGALDLLLMPHVLEYASNPHQVLREAARVLRPEGRLVLSGFNPRSLWGLARAFHGADAGFPWTGSFINLPRLKDWMALLGLEVAAGSMCCYRPPINREAWLKRLRFMEPAGDRWWAMGGGVYFLQAVKRVQGMHVIQPQWSTTMPRRLLPQAAKVVNLRSYRVQRDR